MNKSKGFTIIELIVVIAIIAVLAAIVMVNVTQYINKGKDASTIGNLNTMVTNAAVYFDSNASNFGDDYIGSPNASASISAISKSDNNATDVTGRGDDDSQNWCVEATTYNNGIQCSDNTGFVGSIAATHCSATVFTCK